MSDIYVFGHKNPDTDTVTAAISLAYLKTCLKENATPYILGNINKETEYVLKKFKTKTPKLLSDTKLQIKDINYHKNCFLNKDYPIKYAINMMDKNNITGLPLIDKSGKYFGLATSKMINNYIANCDMTLDTNIYNIEDSLNAKIANEVSKTIKGKIVLGTNVNSFDYLEDFIVIADSNFEEILAKKPTLLIASIPNNTKLNILAKKYKVNLITTKKSILNISKNIILSNKISLVLTNDLIEVLNENSYFDEFKETYTSLGHNNYPVVDNKNKCLGLLRTTDINSINRKKVILVDHNDENHSVDGLDEAEIISIVDHHQIGNLNTIMPIEFRNMNVGSTNTIIYQMFRESSVPISSKIAGLMLAGIISDTIILTSPTTTDYDIKAVKALARIAKTSYKKLGKEMFKKGTSIEGIKKEDIINDDLKTYQIENKKIAISHVMTLNHEDILKDKNEYVNIIELLKKQAGYDMVLLCLTDIVDGGSYFLYDQESEAKIKQAFNLEYIEEGFYIEKIISRKQQIVPAIINIIKRVD